MRSLNRMFVVCVIPWIYCRIAGSNPLFHKKWEKTTKRLRCMECQPTQFRQTSPRRIMVRSPFQSAAIRMRSALFVAELLRVIPMLAIKFGTAPPVRGEMRWIDYIVIVVSKSTMWGTRITRSVYAFLVLCSIKFI